MSRAGTKRGDGKWLGVINCARPRCHVQYEFEVQAEYASPFEHYGFDEETRQKKIRAGELSKVWWAEINSKPLPAGWVRVFYMLYQEGDKQNPNGYEFHNAHCAALYLDSLPGAKTDNEPREEPTVRGTRHARR